MELIWTTSARQSPYRSIIARLNYCNTHRVTQEIALDHEHESGSATEIKFIAIANTQNHFTAVDSREEIKFILYYHQQTTTVICRKRVDQLRYIGLVIH